MARIDETIPGGLFITGNKVTDCNGKVRKDYYVNKDGEISQGKNPDTTEEIEVITGEEDNGDVAPVAQLPAGIPKAVSSLKHPLTSSPDLPVPPPLPSK